MPLRSEGVKVCVLGNSHSACLKTASQSPGGSVPGQELTFFAAYANELNELVLDGTRLVAPTETLRNNLLYTAGQDGVDVPAYDAFLICGVGFRLRPLDRRLSDRVLKAACSENLLHSPAYALARKLRRASSAPIYLMHEPLLDERTSEDVGFEVVDYRDYFPWVQAAVDLPDVHLLRQPEQTLAGRHYTRYDFSKGSVRLAVRTAGEDRAHPDDDHAHMNVDYGLLRLKDFFGVLRGA